MATKHKPIREPRMKFNLPRVAGFFKVVLGIIAIAVMHAIIDAGLLHAEEITGYVYVMFQNLMDFDFDWIHIVILLVGAGTFIWGHFMKKNYPECGKWLTVTADVFTIALFAAHTLFDYSAGGFVLTSLVLIIFHFITLKAHRRSPILVKLIILGIVCVIGFNFLGTAFELAETLVGIFYQLSPEEFAFLLCWLVWIVIWILQLVAVLKKPRY